MSMYTPNEPSAPYTHFSTQLTGSLDQITKMIQDNAEMIDLIQSVALELTHSIGTLHTLTVQYAGIAKAVLDILLPVLRGLPLIPANIMEMLTGLEGLTQQIVDNQASTSKTITDVQSGLSTGDVSKLQNHASDLRSLTQSLMAILPK